MATRVARPPDGPWPPAGAASGKTISLVVNVTATRGGAPAELGHVFQVWPEDAVRWRDEVRRAYVESGLFSSVQLGLAPADLQATVDILVADEFDQHVAMLGGMTFTLLPVSGDTVFKMRTELRNATGAVSEAIDVSETRRVWIQAFLLPVGAFGQPRSASAAIVGDLGRATLRRIAADGVAR